MTYLKLLKNSDLKGYDIKIATFTTIITCEFNRQTTMRRPLNKAPLPPLPDQRFSVAPAYKAPPPPLPPDILSQDSLMALNGDKIRVADNDGYADLNQISQLFAAYDKQIAAGEAGPLSSLGEQNQVKEGIYAPIPDFRPNYPAPPPPLPPEMKTPPKPPSTPPPTQPGPPLPPSSSEKPMRGAKANDLNVETGKKSQGRKKLPSADKSKHHRPPRSSLAVSTKAASQQQSQAQSAEANKENDLTSTSMRRPGK